MLQGSKEIHVIRCVVCLSLDLLGYEISFPCVRTILLLHGAQSFLRS